MSHFLTVRFPGKQRNEYGAPAAFFKVADPAAGRILLTLFREDCGAVAPKGQGLVFDLVAAEGLSPAQAVRFNAFVRRVQETWEQAWSVTDGPDFSGGSAGDLARLYDRAEKWQAEMPEGEQAAPIPKAVPEPLQVTFAKGRFYDVWHALECKLREARDHVWLEDAFINGDVVALLASIPEQLPVRVLTKKFYDGADASLRKLGKQRSGRLEVKATGEIHGRRLFVDHRVWETSESIKDLAFKTASTVKEIDSPVDAAKLRDDFEGRWKASQRRYCNDKGNED
jgi:hypothetical protein